MSEHRFRTPIARPLHPVLIPLCSSRPTQGNGGKYRLSVSLSSILPPNIAQTMEWNAKEIKGNSFFWNSFLFGIVPSSWVNHGSTCTSSLWPSHPLRSLSQESSPTRCDESPGLPQDGKQQTLTTLSLPTGKLSGEPYVQLYISYWNERI